MMYQFFIRPILFLFDAERAHHIAFRLLGVAEALGFTRLYKFLFVSKSSLLRKEVMGIVFDNPVGLAAGFDKDAKRYNAFGDLGFGFVEIGTLTPKAQPGNEKKRLFRLKKDDAIINRMGFNNNGVHVAVNRLRKSHRTIVGGNIGKNKITPNENAVEDYLYALKTLYPYVDYFVVNVSSPNTPGLRDLQLRGRIETLVKKIQHKQNEIEQLNNKPIFIKISPDLEDEQLRDIALMSLANNVNGLIISNSTLKRSNTLTSLYKNEVGGLSGKPLFIDSTIMLKKMYSLTNGQIPLIGVGGITNGNECYEKIKAGASLIQLYTALVYHGPKVVSKIIELYPDDRAYNYEKGDIRGAFSVKIPISN